MLFLKTHLNLVLLVKNNENQCLIHFPQNETVYKLVRKLSKLTAGFEIGTMFQMTSIVLCGSPF